MENSISEIVKYIVTSDFEKLEKVTGIKLEFEIVYSDKTITIKSELGNIISNNSAILLRKLEIQIDEYLFGKRKGIQIEKVTTPINLKK